LLNSIFLLVYLFKAVNVLGLRVLLLQLIPLVVQVVLPTPLQSSLYHILRFRCTQQAVSQFY